MTRTGKHKLLSSAAILLSLLMGMAGGYLCGCLLVLTQTVNRLENASARVQDRVAYILTESFGALDQLSRSTENYCSDEELHAFNLLIFHSEFISDAGRIRNGRIECSGIQGRLQKPHLLSEPVFKEIYQGKLYTHYKFIPPDAEFPENHAVQLGEFYVLFSNRRYANMFPPPINYFRRIGSLNSRVVEQNINALLDIQLLPNDHDAVLLNKGTLYYTNCQSRLSRASCVTSYLSVRTALAMERWQIRICILFGALAGLFFGVLWFISLRRSLSMENQLRRAIRKGQLQLLYQPIVELGSGRVVEAEALARWTDEDGFMVSPTVFIPMAEEGGFIRELTDLVIRTVLNDLTRLVDLDPDFRVNVNITAKDLADEEFPHRLELALATAGIEPRNLAIEITESSTAKLPGIRQTIAELRGRGHSVQIDDFGTGYSSLSYLSDLEVDAIKIDRAFTHAIGTEAVTVAILPQILAMAKALKLLVIAEGVETAEQAAYFAGVEEGKVLGQGWLFGHPEPLQVLLERLSHVHASQPVPTQAAENGH